MYARNVTLHLKANKGAEFTRTLENDILPMLRKQSGFKDEITFLATDSNEAVAISLWEKRENAEADEGKEPGGFGKPHFGLS